MACSLCGDLKTFEEADLLLGKPLSPAAERFLEAHRVEPNTPLHRMGITCRECGQDYELDVDTELLTWTIDLRRCLGQDRGAGG